ncbi:MAG TPA: protein kinase, partial [Sandaracinaceae bacterium LLY-WYZ-13_1]|nr:protein kinase [Sandaracinaceae bacterium LLY-WYZ-13_1]
GGMGLVVAARDRRLQRTVALKVLHGALQEEPAVVRRFLVEAQVGAQLEHPNIVPVYGMEEDGEAPAFTMRLLGRRTLKSFLVDCREREKTRRVDEDHALPSRLERFLKVCDAIAYAHSQGVIHRDLKPGNVILGEHHQVYLVDWGVAKVLGEEEDLAAASRPPGEGLRPTLPDHAADAGVSVSVAGETQHGELIGTPTYMPPEQASGRLEQHGPASDQFALGMMLQELCTLVAPREGDLMSQIFEATRGERAPFDAMADGKKRPAALAAIVARATAADPEARYPSVEAFADDVRRFARGEEVSVHPDPWTTRVWRRLSRRPAVVLGAVSAVLIVALVAAVASLASSLRTQERAAAQSERLAELTSAVVRRSEGIDARFARARELVEGLAVAVEGLWTHGAPVEGELAYGVAGRLVDARGPPLRGLHDVDHYGDVPVTYESGLYLYPPDVPFASVERTIRVMAPLNRHFRQVLLRSAEEDAPSWSRPRQAALLDAGETPLHVTYVGFESGLLLNYPGYEPFPDGYDPRRRPWYRESRDTWGVHFGRPYPDASGSAILVPTNRALRTPEGDRIGVAGADMALDDLADEMRFDLPGWQRSTIVDEAGAQIIDTEQEGLRLGVGLHDDAPIEARPLAPEVWEAIQRESTGWVRRDDELVVFDRLEEVGWTFTARFDARAVLGR